MKKVLPLIIIIITFFNGCIKNEITVKNIIPPNVPFDNATKITTVVTGTIIAQDGNPLENVEVSIGSSTTYTDIDGNFIISKATLSENAGFIKASKFGYFTGSRTIMAIANSVNHVFIQLVTKTKSGSFVNANGGTINIATGGSIIFPSNAVVTKSGTNYTGTVNVSAYFLDPSSEHCYNEMPGALRGINLNNDEQELTTYGMMAVELNGTNGEALQLAPNKNAIISFPIVSATQVTAPASIPLWFFDETKGMWVEEGSATKVGNTYVGSVSHFTWWNCDWGGGPITYTSTFIDQNGNALSNYRVYYITSSGWGGGGGSGLTASNGSLRGTIPINRQIIVKVMSNCSNTVLFTTTVGPFSQNTNGGTHVVNVPNSTVTIIGTVKDCNNNLVANGYALIRYKNKIYYTYISNGLFTNTIFNCSSNYSGTALVDVFDLATLTKNLNPITVNINNAGTYNIGQVAACGLKAGVRYIANFVNPNGVGLSQYYVSFTGDSTMTTYPSNSTLNTIIQANKALIRKVYVLNSCGTYVLADSTLIGPYAADFNAGTVTITAPPIHTLTISGTAIDCNILPIASGVATIFLDGKTYNTNIINGSFSQLVEKCYSPFSSSFAMINILNNANQHQNATPYLIQVFNANVNTGNLLACNTSNFEFLRFTFKGSVDSYTDSLDASRIIPPGGSSNYTTTIKRTVNNPTSSFNLNFNAATTGTYTTTSLGNSINLTAQNINYFNNNTNNIFININEYGNVGQYIGGTFNGTLADSLNVTQGSSIFGSFRIIRRQ
ncbi:MAG: hypothetical protein KGZ59_03625 [Chitinophagaceae bacterium]|nr:hypothetical protein [Chitinophagaceae bacterium]